VGQHNLCLDENGEILNNVMFRNNNCGEYVAKSCKVRGKKQHSSHETSTNQNVIARSITQWLIEPAALTS
jgi:hypothetical protein